MMPRFQVPVAARKLVEAVARQDPTLTLLFPNPLNEILHGVVRFEFSAALLVASLLNLYLYRIFRMCYERELV